MPWNESRALASLMLSIRSIDVGFAVFYIYICIHTHTYKRNKSARNQLTPIVGQKFLKNRASRARDECTPALLINDYGRVNNSLLKETSRLIKNS